MAVMRPAARQESLEEAILRWRRESRQLGDACPGLTGALAFMLRLRVGRASVPAEAGRDALLHPGCGCLIHWI